VEEGENREERGRNIPREKAQQVPKTILEPIGAKPRSERESAAIQAKAAGTNPAYLRKARKLDNEQLRAVIDGKAALTKAHVANNSGENEWYTPEPILEAARSVLGTFDLDPASSELANATVKAKRFFDTEQDGLEQEWTGRVWMNPPYAKDLIVRFAEKLVASLDKIEAITLTNNSTDTQWFQAMASRSSAICLLSGRVKFISPIGTSSAPLQGQAVLYFGKQLSKFIAEFEHLGTCYVRTTP
jgi:ParB family chromosome partitioning protein